MSQATTRALRTVLQTAVGIAVLLPAMVDSGALPRSLPWAGAALTVSGLLSRAMAAPAVQALLPAWLTTPDDPATAPTPTTPADGTPDAPAATIAPLTGPGRTTTATPREAHDAD